MGAALAVSLAAAGWPLGVVQGLGLLAATVAVGGAFLLSGARARALSVLAALILTPALLAAELVASGQLGALGGLGAPVLAAGGLVALASELALALVFLRRPGALPVAVLVALPFRIPIEAGGQTANLLVPLYAVIGAGGLAYAVARILPATLPAADGPRHEPVHGPLELALLGMIALYALQALYSTDFALALRNGVFFYVPFALLLKLLSVVEWSPRLLRRCLAVSVALAIAFVAVGFWEFATRRLLFNPKVLASNQFGSYFRVNSLFFDPNIYGRFLAIVMLALAGVLLWTRDRRRAALATVALAVLWAGLVLTFSQSSFVALLAGLLVLGALRWHARGIALAGAGVCAAGLVVVLALPGLVRVDLASAESLDAATSGRFDLMRGGLEIFADRPLVGYGSGSFSERFRAREDATSAQIVSASHTIPITIAAEQGVVGLAAYALALWAAGLVLLRGLRTLSGPDPPAASPVARGVMAAAFAALLLHTLLYAAFLEDPLSWTLLGIALGLSPRALTLSGRRAPAGTRPPARTDLHGPSRPASGSAGASASARTRTGSSSP